MSGGVVGIIAGGLFQETEQRNLGVRLQAMGNALVVLVQPRLVLHVILLLLTRLRDVECEYRIIWRCGLLLE